MRLSERFFVFFLLSCIVFCTSKDTKRKGRHFLALLGYLHGFKIGQDFASQYPPYLVSPIILYPSGNLQQSVNIQQAGTDDNYQEFSGTQSFKPTKLLDSQTKRKRNDVEKLHALKRKTPHIEKLQDDSENSIELRQNEILNINKSASSIEKNETSTNETQAVTTKPPDTNTTASVEIPLTTTKPNGPYDSPTYNNDAVNSLTLTTDADEEINLPPVNDKRWQNFKANISSILSDDNETSIMEMNNSTTSNIMTNTTETITTNSTEIVTENPNATVTYGNGPYSNRLYNNALIDQLSITTNRYTGDDLSYGWSSSTNEIMGQKSNGFKPLAGLYYDGFLHRPLKKFGFFPPNYEYQQYYNYN